MSNQLIEKSYAGQYGGENRDTFIDVSQGNHHTIGDGIVCCRPIELTIEFDNDQYDCLLIAKTDSE